MADEMIVLTKGVKIKRGAKIPKAAKGWKVITPGKLGFKASCETQFERRGERFGIFRFL